MAATVQTVTGPVPSDELGFTLPHEHLVFGMAGWHHDLVDHPSHEEQVSTCEQHVRRAADVGVRTLVEVSTPEMGRDVGVMRDVAERTGVHIVCATGLYARRPSAYFLRRSAAEMAELFVAELEDGIGDTPVRAALIKCAVEAAPLAEHEHQVLRAAAQASSMTGAPIMVHVEPGAALTVGRTLAEHGVPGRRVAIAHAETGTDVDGLLELVEEHGQYVCFDRFGYEVTMRDDVRRALVTALCQLGHADRVLLSHDHVCVLFGRDANRWEDVKDLIANWDFPYLPEKVIPRLLRDGVDQSHIDQMTVANPAAYLAG